MSKYFFKIGNVDIFSNELKTALMPSFNSFNI